MPFGLADEYYEKSVIKDEESQIFTFIIDDILLESEYDYMATKPIIYTEDSTTLPSILHWGESDLKPSTGNDIFQSDQLVTHVENTTTMHNANVFKFDAFTKVIKFS